MVSKITHVYGMLQADVGQMQFFQLKMLQDIYVCNQSNAKVFCNKRCNRVFIRRFTDDIRLQGVRGIGAERKFPQAGIPVITDDGVSFQVFE